MLFVAACTFCNALIYDDGFFCSLDCANNYYAKQRVLINELINGHVVFRRETCSPDAPSAGALSPTLLSGRLAATPPATTATCASTKKTQCHSS